MRVRSQFFKKDYDLSKAQLIGQGTFAQVYRAFESGLNDSIAIRRVRKIEADLQDIIKERQINDELRKVDNQNILKIYDIVQQTEAVWYITQYCSGGSLWDALNLCPDNKMTERQGLQCILQISRGVQQLHNHRITHRDLKPENILLKTKYIPGKALPLIKLADFGLSTRKIIMQTIAGTKEYIAPQQAKFHNYTNAVDVWSLGIIFDQILHGTPFYCGQDNKQVFNKILKMAFKVRDERLRPSIKELLISLLKKKPYERPIIAIIRVNIEKIIKEIDDQIGYKLETPNQKGKKSKSNSNYDNNSTSQNIRCSIGYDLPHKINFTPKIQNVSVYRSHNVIQKNMDRIQRIERKPQDEKLERGYYKKDVKPPSYQARPSVQKEVENASTEVNEPKQFIKNLQKSTSINYIIKKVDRQKQKTPPKTDKVQHKQPQSAKPARLTARQQAEVKVPLFGIPQLPEKITIYKVQRRKLMGSSVSARKQQLRFQLADISKYMQRVYISKKQRSDKQLKLQKQRIFLPNTYLTAADFQKIIPTNKQMLSNFTKKFEFLNYLSMSTSYEIKMIKSKCQFEQNRRLCEQQLMGSRQAIRQLFFSQLYAFVDQFIDKVIK